MVVLATLFGALLLAAASASGEPTFTNAHFKDYFDRDSLCFDSPVDLDWEAIARRELKSFPIDDPSDEDFRKRNDDMTGFGLKFHADLPETFTRLHFYLITEKGVQPIVPERLLGIIRYDHHTPDKATLEGFTGQICLPVPNDVTDAGFVATSKVPLSWQTEPASLARSDSKLRVRLEGGSTILPPPGISRDPAEVKTLYILSSAELAGKYLLVRRVVDPTGCEFTYDIYRWEKGLPVIASSAYGCDI